MSSNYMVSEINRNIHLFTVTIYLWLRNIPITWPFIVQDFEQYSPLLVTRIIKWQMPNMGGFKCNTNGFCKGNLRPIAAAFCISNEVREFVYAKLKMRGKGTFLEAEFLALKCGLEHCVTHNLLQLC